MILLGLTIFAIVIGIIITIYVKIKHIYILDSELPSLGVILMISGGVVLLMEILILILKPVNFIKFKSKYDIFNNITLSENDLRDAGITKELIDINYDININKIMKDNLLIGIFYNEEIANLDLLNKEVK